MCFLELAPENKCVIIIRDPFWIIRDVLRTLFFNSTINTIMKKLSKIIILQTLLFLGLMNSAQAYELTLYDTSGGPLYTHWGARLSIKDVLEKAIREGAILDRISLPGANLRGIELHHVYMNNSNFDGADLRDANISFVEFGNSSFKGTWFHNSIFERVDFLNSDFTNASFRDTTISDSYFVGATFDNTHLEGSTMYYTDFTAAQSVDSNFKDAELNNCTFDFSNIDISE